MPGRDLRGLILLAHSIAHEISEDALELERRLGRQRYYASQVADAGITVLAHVACAGSLIPPYDLQSRIELRASLHGAIQSLDELRSLLKHSPRLAEIAPDVHERMANRVEELIAVIRALSLECDREYHLKIA
jgi:hypothetical protein